MTIAQRILTPVVNKATSSPMGNDSPLPPPPPPRLLACSASVSLDRNQQRLFVLKDLDRKLCEDRKTPFEHLMPAALAKSTFRIVVTQGSFVLSNYAQDQLQQDIARDKLVAEGQMTQEEADDEADEWETREWKQRWESFPSKLTEALVKYHVIVLVMRLYEYFASNIVDKMSLDALTLDTFQCAKRLDAKLFHNHKDGETTTVTTTTTSRSEFGKQMFGICWRANLIAFLADYSVHQLILGYGYYQFINGRQQRRKRRKEEEQLADDEEDDDEVENNDHHPIVKQSATLVLSRSLGLVFTAAGGAVGSILYPGWGTLLGSNLGDSLGGVVSEAV